MSKAILFALPVFLALILVLFPDYVPRLVVYPAMFLDVFTPWNIFESTLWRSYHDYVLSRLPEREALSLPTVDGNDFTIEDIRRVSKDFSWPIIIKGLCSDCPALEKWKSKKWWEEKYGNEEILCGSQHKVRENCTISTFFDDVANGDAAYVAGDSEIFNRHPDLLAMVNNDKFGWVPEINFFNQLYMGMGGMGTDIHCAGGINVFRQIVGRKNWVFIPPSQTAYLIPSVTKFGGAIHTITKVGKAGDAASPWMSKLERYTYKMLPGDILINPPLFWHGIINEAEDEDGLVIGVPTRYGADKQTVVATFTNNLPLAMLQVMTMVKNNGVNFVTNLGKSDAKYNLEGDRKARMK